MFGTDLTGVYDQWVGNILPFSITTFEKNIA